MLRKIPLLVLVLLVFSALPLQVQAQTAGPSEVLISIYNIAPGKHLDFLKWMAAQSAIATEAGAPATQWYAHASGASWDYIAVGPVLSDEMDKKIDELTKKKNMATGMKASLEFRQFVSSHSDTEATGPMSVSDMVKSAEK